MPTVVLSAEPSVQESDYICCICTSPPSPVLTGRPVSPLPRVLVQTVGRADLSSDLGVSSVFLCRYSPQHFRELIEKVNLFISIRLFPPKKGDLPSPVKCSWWIPSAIKMLAILCKHLVTDNHITMVTDSAPPDASNNLSSPLLVDYKTFYNESLDHTDLMTEYYAWQSPQGFVTM